ncbi:MAG: sigma-70 family RNA polymerase sigma factor [Terriglobales bacterium]
MNAAARHYEVPQGPDAAERERLLLEHLPQVRYLARRIHERLPQQVLLEDLVQAGVVGLIDALHKYDPARNAQLGTYARFRIRGAILDSLRALDWSPRELRRQGRELQAAAAELQEKLRRAPTAGEICEALSLSSSEYHRLVAALDRLELDAGRAEPDAPPAVETAVSPDPDPFQLCERNESKELLARLIAELPPRDQQILSLYYFEELTMKEVGQVLGIGESRISQIHSALLTRMRAKLRATLVPKAQAPWGTQPPARSPVSRAEEPLVTRMSAAGGVSRGRS